MLTLSTKDLIRRAKQLADLENSDFISWNENIHLINEMYQKLYQKAINRGEKLYLKSYELEANSGTLGDAAVYSLPGDFYQLESLVDRNNGRAITRRTVNAPKSESGYEIKNSELLIYGAQPNTLTLSYYPAPPTLTFPANDVDFEVPSQVSLPQESKFFDIFDKKIVWLDVVQSTPSYKYKLSYYDFLTGDTREEIITTLPAPNEIFGLVAGRNGICIALSATATNSGRKFYYDWTLFERSRLNFSALIIDQDKNILSFARYDNREVMDPITRAVRGSVPAKMYEYIGGETGVIPVAVILERGQFLKGAWLHDTDVYEMDQYSSDRNFLCTTGYQKYLMYCAGSLMSASGDRSCVVSRIEQDYYNPLDINCIGINKCDEETGYGYTTMDKIKSVFEDTELDYPNSMFVQWISYAIALAYKSKQNAPAEGLTALYAEAEEQFYDSIPQDDYQSVRIQNVY